MIFGQLADKAAKVLSARVFIKNGAIKSAVVQVNIADDVGAQILNMGGVMTGCGIAHG